MTQSSYNAASRTYSASSTSPARSALNPSNAPPGYRNGYKPRRLNTRVGTLELLIPQDRDGGAEPSCLRSISVVRKPRCSA